MSHDAWPSSSEAPEGLPRLEELPLSDRGYDQEAVRRAFDSFYRHAARLDTSLRALEAVDAFRRDADALRNDIRALRSLNLGSGGTEPGWASESLERRRSDAAGIAVRLAAESALIIAVAVVATVGHFRTEVIVGLMAGTFAIVALSEWIASRSRFISPAAAFVSPQAYEASAVLPAAPVWGPPEEPADELELEPEPEAMTMVAPPQELDEPLVQSELVQHAAPDPWEQAPVNGPVAADEGAAEPAGVDVARSGLFRRRR